MADPQRYLSEFRMIRGACVLTALLVLVLQGSSGGHMLLVEHSRCAEHGELVHGDAHQHEVGADRQAESLLLQGTPNSSPDQAHGHCSGLSDRRDALVSIGTVGAGIRVPEAQAVLRLLGANIAPNASRLRLAPKTSPPA
jgi:hypothetical protein